MNVFAMARNVLRSSAPKLASHNPARAARPPSKRPIQPLPPEDCLFSRSDLKVKLRNLPPYMNREQLGKLLVETLGLQSPAYIQVLRDQHLE